MENILIQLDIKRNLLRGLAIITLAGLILIVLNSDIRSSIRTTLKPNQRVVLAVAQADLLGNGEKSQILKIKTGEGLFIEVYGQVQHETYGPQEEMVASVKLPDKKDGYFTFNGEVTNLAVDDINNDKKPEILVTSFDDDLVAHLNVYRYVPGHKELELVHLD